EVPTGLVESGLELYVRAGAISIDRVDVAPPQRHIEPRPGRCPACREHVTPLRERCAAGSAIEPGAVVLTAARDRLQQEVLGVRPGQTEAQSACLAHVLPVVRSEIEALGGVDTDVPRPGIDKACGAVEP